MFSPTQICKTQDNTSSGNTGGTDNTGGNTSENTGGTKYTSCGNTSGTAAVFFTQNLHPSEIASPPSPLVMGFPVTEFGGSVSRLLGLKTFPLKILGAVSLKVLNSVSFERSYSGSRSQFSDM